MSFTTLDQDKSNAKNEAKALAATKQLFEDTFSNPSYNLPAFIKSFDASAKYKRFYTTEESWSTPGRWVEGDWYNKSGYYESGSSGSSNVTKEESKKISLSDFMPAADFVRKIADKVQAQESLESLHPEYKALKSAVSVKNISSMRELISFIEESEFSEDTFENYLPRTQADIIQECFRKAMAETPPDTVENIKSRSEYKKLAKILLLPSEFLKEFEVKEHELNSVVTKIKDEFNLYATDVKSLNEKDFDKKYPFLGFLSKESKDIFGAALKTVTGDLKDAFDATESLETARRKLAVVQPETALPAIDLKKAVRDAETTIVKAAKEVLPTLMM